MFIEQFVKCDDVNDSVGELLEAYSQISNIVDKFSRFPYRADDVSNEAMSLLLAIQAEIIRVVLKKWEGAKSIKVIKEGSANDPA